MAEFDEVATGERTPGLLQAATRRETAEIDRREAETFDELFDECGRFGMVPRDEDHSTSPFLHRAFIEAGGDDRIERLDDAGTWCQGRHDLAGALAAEIGEDDFGLVSTKGFVASMSTRPFQAGRLFNADATFRHGTASKT